MLVSLARPNPRVIASCILLLYIALAIAAAALVVGPALTRFGTPRYDLTSLSEACKKDPANCPDAEVLRISRLNDTLREHWRATHEVYWADSETYMSYADHPDFSRVLTLSYSALGPGLLVFVTRGSTVIICVINCLLLALALTAAARCLPINPLIFVVLLVLNPMLFFSLTSVNKEIMAFSSLIFAAIFLERSGWQYCAAALTLAALARWPQFVLLAAFFIVRWLNGRFSRSPRFLYVWLALALLTISIAFPIIRRQPALHRVFLMEKTWAAGQMQRAHGLLEVLNSLQNNHWYGLVVAIGPKVILQWTGNIFRVGGTLSGKAAGLNYKDIYNTYVVLGHQLWMTAILAAALILRRLRWASYTVQLMVWFALMTAAIPYINYRLMFPLAGLMAFQIASKNNARNGREAGCLRPLDTV